MTEFQPRPLPPNLRLRLYSPADLDGCMGVFESNRLHTLPDSPQLMREYLNGPKSRYFVVEGPSGIVGCGGIEPSADVNLSHFCFGMVARGHHGRGIGTLLAIARLAAVDCSQGEEMLLLETSHYTESFYRRFGFEPVSGYEARYGFGLEYIQLGMWLYPEMQLAARTSMREYSQMMEIVHQ